MNDLIDLVYKKFLKVKYNLLNKNKYIEKPIIGDRVKILKNISHVNNGYKSVYSRKKYFIIAHVNDIYILNDNCIYRFYEIKIINKYINE